MCCSPSLSFVQVLCVHLNRLHGDRKLSTRVMFDRELDLTHFTPTIRAADVATGNRSNSYRLCSVVCHHGGAVGGHYTCYRQHDRYHKTDEDGLQEVKEEAREESKEQRTGEAGEEKKEARTDKDVRASRSAVDRVWVHVSDDDVRRVSWREVASCEAYMLFYEKET